MTNPRPPFSKIGVDTFDFARDHAAQFFDSRNFQWDTLSDRPRMWIRLQGRIFLKVHQHTIQGKVATHPYDQFQTATIRLQVPGAEDNLDDVLDNGAQYKLDPKPFAIHGPLSETQMYALDYLVSLQDSVRKEKGFALHLERSGKFSRPYFEMQLTLYHDNRHKGNVRGHQLVRGPPYV